VSTFVSRLDFGPRRALRPDGPAGCAAWLPVRRRGLPGGPIALRCRRALRAFLRARPPVLPVACRSWWLVLVAMPTTKSRHRGSGDCWTKVTASRGDARTDDAPDRVNDALTPNRSRFAARALRPCRRRDVVT
jgi:hypothetical protein